MAFRNSRGAKSGALKSPPSSEAARSDDLARTGKEPSQTIADRDLAAVLAAWPSLPVALRRLIAETVRQAAVLDDEPVIRGRRSDAIDRR
jgi:hypothetical protein